ncbi:MAG: DUF3365 domain-containing protein [Alphaproteobacteria bacterium]|nr:DUF3365 domain-containing protein [Alphaproteobacteria bacterium]
MSKNHLLAALALFCSLASAPALAQDADALKSQAAQNTAAFGDALKEELVGALNAGGPIAAIGACNEKAPAIAKAKSQEGWRVGRTSLKLRNTGNTPDAWEQATLAEFEARKAKGEPAAQLAKAEIVTENGQKTFRFMKAIPTAPLCLSCHGAEIKPEVAAKLDALYPKDKARGFAEGDLRGAFTLSKKL